MKTNILDSGASAEKAMMKDICAVKKLTQIVSEEHLDRMNTDKGFYEREETLVSCGGMRFSLRAT